tara:strand:- start:260 stop:448 length:189 start_codon:yes stop_codon:yes gene_type:complete
MSEREKLKKQIRNVHGDQIMDNEIKQDVEDKYPIEIDILSYALNYIPLKILKKIIKDNEVTK